MTASASGTLRTVKLLVVEDAVDLPAPIVAGLTASGYEVDQATDGRTALAMAQERAYDLIVLDIMLPKPGWGWRWSQNTRVCWACGSNRPSRPMDGSISASRSRRTDDRRA